MLRDYIDLEKDKEAIVREYITKNLGPELADKYMIMLKGYLDSKEESIKSALMFFSEKEIIEMIDYDVMTNITVVKDTRLARKMYPKHYKREDGMLVVEILGEILK